MEINLDLQNIKSNFLSDGFVHLKNFFNKNEAQMIADRCKEIVEDGRSIYDFKIDELKKLNISNEIKVKIIEKCNNNDFKLKKLSEFTDFIYPLLFDLKENEKLFTVGKIHSYFCKVFDKKGFDIIFDENLSEIILKDRLVQIIKTILETDQLIYWCESGLQYNKPSVKGWHTDDPLNEINNNFRKTFQVRIAIYFHSNPKYSGGIKLIPKSHNRIRPIDFLKGFFKGRYHVNNINKVNLSNSKNFFPNSTDILIWDKRLFHSPWATKTKFIKNLSLSPKIEKILPNFLQEPPCFPRSLLAFDIGKKSEELSNYLNNWISVRKDYNEIWKIKNKNYLGKEKIIKKYNLFFDETCISDNKIESFKTINQNHKELLFK
jgi:hypothetical protein